LRFREVLLDDGVQKIFNVMFSTVKPTTRQKEIIDSLLEDTEQIKQGIEKIEIDTEGELPELTELPEEIEDKNVNYMDILKHIIPLICMLTIHSRDTTSLVSMLKYMEDDKHIYNILLDQTKSWWGKNIDKRIISVVITVYVKYLKDDPEIAQIIRTVKELFVKNIRNSRELSKLIDTYLIPQELEKKSNAEVSTPFKLRQEMMDKIPLEFWTTLKKVFEPCSGKGGFILDIVDRFTTGLEEAIPDEIVRYQTIVEECLYFCDINPTNIFICKLLLDPYADYTLNFHTGNTLELDIHEKWGIYGFDAVIGNPPYQPRSNNKKGGKSLWDKFVKYSLTILAENGLLLYVHPALWRKPGNKMRDIMFNKQIHYLSIHNKVEGNKVFGATTRYDHYLMENIEPYKKSKVYFEDKKMYEIMIDRDLPFIPNFGWTIFEKIINKLNDNGINLIGDSDCHTTRPHVSKNKKDGFNYILLNSISKTKGKTYCYSSRPHKNQSKKKVIFSNGETIVPFYDNGQLGVTQGGLYIIVETEDEGETMVNYLNTDIIKFIVKSTKWSNFETNKQIFNYIPNIANEPDINNNSVYKYFNITDDEIKQINDCLYNKK
jgi:hypothetical protein